MPVQLNESLLRIKSGTAQLKYNMSASKDPKPSATENQSTAAAAATNTQKPSEPPQEDDEFEDFPVEGQDSGNGA